MENTFETEVIDTPVLATEEQVTAEVIASSIEEETSDELEINEEADDAELEESEDDSEIVDETEELDEEIVVDEDEDNAAGASEED